MSHGSTSYGSCLVLLSWLTNPPDSILSFLTMWSRERCDESEARPRNFFSHNYVENRRGGRVISEFHGKILRIVTILEGGEFV